eukprot:gnl/TRDRNA2_/TRDRNA2_28837_c0_seq1.p1 gnl/TRDRNA2_/TRDRNA2_28837_c0~~gnl/TRDRNA2_/TRDRNA2_28837_c0_seq1.p1  ORF type:complete len:113 (-),score=5.26 gnl/TRDRNA2_/TRDRNA2_28837_c0_seq1:142-480(-)
MEVYGSTNALSVFSRATNMPVQENGRVKVIAVLLLWPVHGKGGAPLESALSSNLRLGMLSPSFSTRADKLCFPHYLWTSETRARQHITQTEKEFNHPMQCNASGKKKPATCT